MVEHFEWGDDGDPMEYKKMYSGEWVHGKRHGNGLLIWFQEVSPMDHKAQWYEGGWKNDKRDGRGFENRNGEYRIGEWKDGTFSSKCVFNVTPDENNACDGVVTDHNLNAVLSAILEENADYTFQLDEGNKLSEYKKRQDLYSHRMVNKYNECNEIPNASERKSCLRDNIY